MDRWSAEDEWRRAVAVESQMLRVKLRVSTFLFFFFSRFKTTVDYSHLIFRDVATRLFQCINN